MRAEQIVESAGRQLCWLPLDTITPNRMQPRQEFDTLEIMELAASIRQSGLLQPVTVRPCAAGYELIMGERRLRACKLLGHTHIEAFVLPADDAESALLALVENVQRQDLHFFEEAQAYDRLLRLEPEVREAIMEHGLSERHARALLPLPGKEARLRIVTRAGVEKLSVQKTEQLVARALERLPVPAPPRRVISLARDPRLYLNAIRGIVDQMRDTGLAAEYQVNEFDSAVEVRVVVQKGSKR